MKSGTTLKPPKNTVRKPAADPDNPPWTEEMLGPAVVRRGRGKQKAPVKVKFTIRLDPDVVEFFKAQGAGWQSRINDALRLAARKR
ncbi:MAG: BrnA antitoxin family protein [Acidobacteria bacterium]|nr:BrnA antitoxin family protein [Acidobacteriota bacterium]